MPKNRCSIAISKLFRNKSNIYEIHLRGITVVAPLTDDFNPTWLFPQTKFCFDNSGVTCPAGNRTMISNYNKKTGNITYFFKKDICQQCILKEQCTKQERRTVTIGKHFKLVNETREYNMTKEFKVDMKGRANIEPKQAEMKSFHGLRRARYCGVVKLNVQALITGIVVNVKRLANVVGSGCYIKIY